MKSDPVSQEKELSTLLQAATGYMPDSPSAVKEWVKTRGATDLNLTDSFGNAALHYALNGYTQASPEVQERKREIAQFLIENGADPILLNQGGQTPRDFAGESFYAVLEA